MKLLVDGLFGLVFCLGLGGLGYQLAHRAFKLKIDFFSAFLLGCGSVTLLLFIAGIIKIFSPLFFLAIIIVVLLFSITGRRVLTRLRWDIHGKEYLAVALAAIVLVIAGLGALSPPVKNDTLYYHLALPKLWAADSGLRFSPTITLSASALNCELLLTPIVAKVSPEAAQFLVFLIGIFVLLMAVDGARRFGGVSDYLTMLFLIGVPLYVTGLSDAKSDYLMAGFCLGAAFFYFDYIKHKNWKYLLLAGIFAGLAAGTKANALIFAFSLTLVVAFGRPRFKDFLFFIAAIVSLGSIWYIRAFFVTGNPFYPFLNSLFVSSYWPQIFDDFNKAVMPPVEKRTLINLIISPLKLIFWPDIFRGRIGPLPFIMLPLLPIVKNAPKILVRALAIAAIFYLAWFAAWAYVRYLLPIIIILVIIASYIACRLMKTSRLVAGVIMVFAVILVMLNGAQIVRDNLFRAKAALGMIDRDTFLIQYAALDSNDPSRSTKLVVLPYYEAWEYANVALPQKAIVGILCSNWNRADGFYLERRYVYLDPSNQALVDFTLGKQSMKAQLRQNGIDHILIDKVVVAEFELDSPYAGAPDFRVFADGVQNLLDIIKENGRAIYQTDRFILYRLE